MNRRAFVQGGSALAAFGLGAGRATLASAQEQPAASAAEPPPFSHDWLIAEAQRLAGEPFQERSGELPDGYEDISYDQYRAIWFKPDESVWAGEPTLFRVDFFHLGFVYRDPVTIAVVEDGKSRRIPFSTSMFGYGHIVEPPQHESEMDFSGFRVRYPINTPDSFQEFLVFQGASYFRAVARNQIYGISARGLAINTGEPVGEEFPLFRHFWIERPAPDSSTLVVHALLDSVSTTGAYRFEVMPGAETVIEVEGIIFPRQEIQKVGIAPLTSMFLFNAMNRAGFDDFRRAVHDSDGLQMLTGSGEWVWRPLANHSELQISYFHDRRPRGFGLMQRARRYEDFEDLEGKYERRPSLWVEPLGDWGEGYVELVEIPSDEETNDNVVAYWRPKGPVPAGNPWQFSYRLRWTDALRPPAELLVAVSSHAGLSFDKQRRLFVVDFGTADEASEGLAPDKLTAEASASHGAVVNTLVHDRQPDGFIRVSFELDPGSEELSELRLRLFAEGKPASETWLYRWTAS